MSDSQTKTPPDTRREARHENVTERIPMWNVILHDDDDHTYDYVIDMLGKLFAKGMQDSFLMACEVDATGRVICMTSYRERAEFKRDQIRAYGADPRMSRSQYSMLATIEPADIE